MNGLDKTHLCWYYQFLSLVQPTHILLISKHKEIPYCNGNVTRMARIYFADHAAFYIYIFFKKPNNLTAILTEPRFELEIFLERVGKTFKFMHF